MIVFFSFSLSRVLSLFLSRFLSLTSDAKVKRELGEVVPDPGDGDAGEAGAVFFFLERGRDEKEGLCREVTALMRGSSGCCVKLTGAPRQPSCPAQSRSSSRSPPGSRPGSGRGWGPRPGCC